jgi:hypothetical protein
MAAPGQLDEDGRRCKAESFKLEVYFMPESLGEKSMGEKMLGLARASFGRGAGIPDKKGGEATTTTERFSREGRFFDDERMSSSCNPW